MIDRTGRIKTSRPKFIHNWIDETGLWINFGQVNAKNHRCWAQLFKFGVPIIFVAVASEYTYQYVPFMVTFLCSSISTFPPFFNYIICLSTATSTYPFTSRAHRGLLFALLFFLCFWRFSWLILTYINIVDAIINIVNTQWIETSSVRKDQRIRILKTPPCMAGYYNGKIGERHFFFWWAWMWWSTVMVCGG